MRILIAIAAACVLTAAAAGVMHSTQPAAQPGAPATDAVPGLVWQSGKATLRLLDKECPFKELRADLEREGLPQVRAYEVEQGGKRSVGCWTTDMGGDVMTLEPGRELGQIPVGWFRADVARRG